MQAEYIRKLNQSNLIITVEKEVQDLDSICMFQYNQIPGFLSFYEQKRNGKQQFCYHITGMQAWDQNVLNETIDYETLYQLLAGIDQCCSYASDYLLSENSILLEPEYIFMDRKGNFFFCYLPDWEQDIRTQLETLMEGILQKIDHKDKDLVTFAYGIYEGMIQNAVALHDLLQEFQKEVDQENQKKEEPEPVIPERPEKVQSVPEYSELEHGRKEQASVFEKLKQILHKKIYTNYYENEEMELVYEPEEIDEEAIPNPTVCLNSDGQKMQNLFMYQGMDRTRDFQFQGQSMLVGSNQKEVDVYIPMPMVSRRHARLEKINNEIYVEDLNSTNGTVVNGEQLPYKKKKLLQKGDVCSFAGENYSVY